MEKVFFDYKLNISTILEKNDIKLKSYDIHELKSFVYGNIYIFFYYHTSKRDFIVLETGIIDYLLQFDDLFLSIEKGIYKTFTISCDYYSNNLLYKYSIKSNIINISEGNANLYTIDCNYDIFKMAYMNFRKKIIKELITFYPDLNTNVCFVKNFIE